QSVSGDRAADRLADARRGADRGRSACRLRFRLSRGDLQAGEVHVQPADSRDRFNRWLPARVEGSRAAARPGDDARREADSGRAAEGWKRKVNARHHGGHGKNAHEKDFSSESLVSSVVASSSCKARYVLTSDFSILTSTKRFPMNAS